MREGFLEEVVQAYLGAIAGSVPDHHSTVSHNLFAGGGSCPQFIKKKKPTTSVEHNKVKDNKMRYAYT